MQLILCKTNDGNNVINKTLLTPESLDINLRKNINISSPELLLKFDDSILQYNYCEIVELGRFYFIDRIESMSKQVWKLYLSIDVLETYKTEILNSECKFHRPIKAGDFINVPVDSTFDKTVDKIFSDKSISQEKVLIMTTLGV